MRYCVLLIAALLSIGSLSARQHNGHSRSHAAEAAATAEADSIYTHYSDALLRLVLNNQYGISATSSPSPYYFRLLGPATLYNSALTELMGLNGNNATVASTAGTGLSQRQLPSLGDWADAELQRYAAINRELDRAYVSTPQLFVRTQNDFNASAPLRTELDQQKVEEEVQLSTKVETPVLQLEIEPVEPEVKKPNFWTLKGNGSMQFTQNYFSSNWYQGGEKNYSMLTALTVDANYDNKQKLQWDNRFEAQLGFQTSETDQYHKFKATSNLLRLTSKIGYKAAKNWNYAAQLQLQTQPYMSYDNNGNVTADFFSPFYIRTSVGMDYKIKKGRFDGSLYLSPLSWNVTYVDRQPLRTRYNVKERRHLKNDWGPNVDFKFTWKMWDNISWQSRLYWFSNFELSRVEWENTFNFTVNKYISAKLFMYPRFDDSSPKYRNEHGDHYWMFKEWLSLGLNYEF